jgi:hypothetical protein
MVDYSKLKKADLIAELRKRDVQKEMLTKVLEEVYENECSDSHGYLRDVSDIFKIPLVKEETSLKITVENFPILEDVNYIDYEDEHDVKLVIDNKEYSVSLIVRKED